MAVCDMCGIDTNLTRSKIEGTILNVCSNCSKFGASISDTHSTRFAKTDNFHRKKKFQPRIQEVNESLIEGFGNIIKERREKLDLKQEDFAMKINEKASLIHKIESGHFEPPIDMAKKMERYLGVKLLEEIESKTEIPMGSDSSKFTLGDYVKVRK